MGEESKEKEIDIDKKYSCKGVCDNAGKEQTSSCFSHGEIKKECCFEKNGNNIAPSCCHEKKADSAEHSCCHDSSSRGSSKEHNETGLCCSINSGKSAPCCGSHSSANMTIYFIIISICALILSFTKAFIIEGLKFQFFHYVDIAWVALLLCGYPIFKNAYKALRRKRINASVLISTAIIASVVLEIIVLANPSLNSGEHSHSYVFAAGEIAVLMAIGGLIEDYTVSKSRAGIERLINLTPKKALVERGSKVVEIPLSEVKTGDIIIVKPGDMIPIDGKITSGVSAVDESNMTGESIPIDKNIGDKVFGGTINLNGAIKVESTSTAEDMTLSKLIKLVEEAGGKKAPISRVADRWASVIVPLAITLSIVVGLVAGLGLHVGAMEAVIRAVTVLVVFCPCSLALAVPTAVSAGLGCGAKNGFLIKSGAALEIANDVRKIAFDKTGTLTKGELSVKEVFCKCDEEHFKRIIKGMESNSTHPIAKALLKYSDKSTGITVKEFKLIEGSGIKGSDGDIEYIISSFTNSGKYVGGEIDNELKIKGEELLRKGNTVVGVIENGTLIGIAALSDTLREDTAFTISALKHMGMECIMLTGDNEFAAKQMGEKAGVNKIYNSLLPEDKFKLLDDLKCGGDKICMVGDGVNDAPSLAGADCSIAFAKLGSDVAIETADVALMNSDIKRLPFFFELAKRVMFTIKGNIILSMMINIVSTVLSVFGYINPAIGALIHNCTSILVVTNSALILTKKDKSMKQI